MPSFADSYPSDETRPYPVVVTLAENPGEEDAVEEMMLIDPDDTEKAAPQAEVSTSYAARRKEEPILPEPLAENASLDDRMDLEASGRFADVLFVIPDTNVLIGRFDEVYTFVEEAQHRSDLCLLIPSVVVAELDGLKNNGKFVDRPRCALFAHQRNVMPLGSLCRVISRWLVECVKASNGAVRGQPHDFVRRAIDNDGVILDLCLSIANTGKDVVLLTNDVNLELRATMESIRVVPVAAGCAIVGTL